MTTADVLFHVAVTYEGMGNHTAARKFYNKLLVSKNYTVLQQLMALEINSLNSSSSLDNLETIVNLVETLTEVPSQTSRFKAMLILVLARVSFSKKLYDDSFALLQFAEYPCDYLFQPTNLSLDKLTVLYHRYLIFKVLYTHSGEMFLQQCIPLRGLCLLTRILQLYG